MAETSPVLSFRLRSKHLVFPWLNHLRRLTLQQGGKDAAALMGELWRGLIWLCHPESRRS
jgi:hypothetical protein